MNIYEVTIHGTNIKMYILASLDMKMRGEEGRGERGKGHFFLYASAMYLSLSLHLSNLASETVLITLPII